MRQRNRHAILIISFLLFPITIFYFSPYLIVMGAFEGVVAGSAIVFSLQFLTALFLGRAGCGWFCPAGGLQDIATLINGKPAKLGWRKYIKYFIWTPWIASIIIGFVIAGGVHLIDPIYHTSYGISVADLMSLGIYMGIILLFFVPNLFLGRRAMCHCICWMAPFMVFGEKLGRFLHLPQLHVSSEPDTCISCGKCTKICPMSLDVQEQLKQGLISDAECIQCAECVDTCPKNTLALKFGKLKGRNS